MKISIVGATGSVGREVCKILAERNLPFSSVMALSSERSAGTKISFGSNTLITKDLKYHDFSNSDIAIFTAGSGVSEKFAMKAASQNCIVIDNTSYFRMLPEIPLIVPEINIHHLSTNMSNIISNPNCVVIPIALVLDLLKKLCKINSVNIATYQSTSGAGKKGMDELYAQTKSKFIFENIEPSIFPRQISFNCIPMIGDISKNGYSEEENKIMQEINKILEDDIIIDVTCVRVPVFNSHGIALTINFDENININDAYLMLSECDYIQTTNNNSHYMTNIDCIGEDAVFVSRLRQNPRKKNSLTMWIMSDNLRKGAALNTVQITEYLMQEILSVPCI